MRSCSTSSSTSSFYQKTMITNKQLDVDTLYLLDKYSRCADIFLTCQNIFYPKILMFCCLHKNILNLFKNICYFNFRYNPAAVSITGFLEHGRDHDQTDSFTFLKKEIPTRLANMIMELRLLPEALLCQQECQEILTDYITSFK